MTSYSKASKRRGRKLRQSVPRHPGGKIRREHQKSPEQEAAEIAAMESKLALDAGTWRRRQALPNLSPEDARKQEFGSVLDAWLLYSNKMRNRGQPERALVSRTQVDAAKRFANLKGRYLAVISAGRTRSSTDFSGPGGFDGSDPFDKGREATDKAVTREYKAARNAILEAAILQGAPTAMLVLEAVACENRHMEDIGAFRVAANVLVRLWGMGKAA